MALLLGSETQYTNEAGLLSGHIGAGQCIAEHTGKIEELAILPNKKTETLQKLYLGVYTSSAEAPKVLLEQGFVEAKWQEHVWSTVTGLAISVTKGTEYWIGFLALGTTFPLLFSSTAEGGTSRFRERTGSGNTELHTEGTWTATNKNGPMSVKALGTSEEGGGGGISLGMIL